MDYQLLRQHLLSAELDRIEALAEANSIAIMNKVDALLAAHNLCQVVNQAEPGVCEFKPFVHYDEPKGGHCAIRIYTHDNGDVFIRRLNKSGLAFEIDGFAFEGHQGITVDGFKGVTIIVKTKFLAPAQLAAAAA